MGLIVSVEEVSSLSVSFKECMNQVRMGLESTRAKVQCFTRDTSQQAASWDSMRSHLSDYEMIINAFIMACQTIQDDCDTVIAEVQNGISPDGRLDEDQLRSTIDCLRQLNNQYESMRSSYQASLRYNRSIDVEFRSYQYENSLISCIERYSALIDTNADKIRDCEEKIEKLYNTQSMTERLFLSAEEFYNCALEGLQATGSAYMVDLLGRPGFAINNNAKWRDNLYSLYARTLFTGEELEEMGLTDKEIYELANDPYVISIEGTSAFYELIESFVGVNALQYISKAAHEFLSNKESFRLVHDGVKFIVKKLPNGKHALKLSGSIVSGKTRPELMEYLADNITSVNWKKYDTKLLTRGGLEFSEKKFGSLFNNIEYKDLQKYLNFATDNGATTFSQLKVTSGAMNDVWKGSWAEHIDNFNFSRATKTAKVVKGLGIVGDVLTIGTNVHDNMFDEEGHAVINKHSVVETVADVGFDMAADAGAAAAGAAVGSFFAPPLGTVVGAGVGFLIGCAGNVDVYDADKDGEKDSFIDMGHKAIDKVCDFFFGED